jgi:hypothetical protein
MDNVNTVGDALREVFSTLINKDGKIFKALVANPDGNGTIEQVFNDMEAVRDKWCNNPDFYNQSGEILEKTMSFFSFLTRLFDESDESLKRRNELLYYRDGDTVWGDYWDVLKIFRRFFGTEMVFIVNNTNPIEENLIADGDFEIQNNSWELNGCDYDTEARFSERTGIKFSDCGSCKQTVNVKPDSTYFLHFFLEGTLAVQIKDNHGRYWNPHAGEFGQWTNSEKQTEFSAGQWDAKNIFFLTDQTISSVTINFIGLHNESAFLDYIRLFLKESYSSFTLIALFGGIYTEDTLGFAPGTNDPIVRRNYEGYGHLSDGKDDADPVNNENVSFVEHAALNENKEPLLSAGTNDVGEIEPANDMYLDEKTPLAPWDGDEPGITVDYSRMSYIEQSHIFGTEGGIELAKSIYTELLEMVRAGGITSYIEILTRELDE